MKHYAVISIGCLCCGTDTSIVGLYDNQEEAYQHLQDLKAEMTQVKDVDFYGGQSKVVVQEISHMGFLGKEIPMFMTSEKESDHDKTLKLWNRTTISKTSR